MTGHTPSTSEVRAHWCGGARMRKGPEFDRWLAQVKAEAQVEALREAAESMGGARFQLSAKADRIAREAGIETGGER